MSKKHGIIVGLFAIGAVMLGACAVTTPGGTTLSVDPAPVVVDPGYAPGYVVPPAVVVAPGWHDHPDFYRPVVRPVVHGPVHAAPVRRRLEHK